jgi:predicted DNA-binding transcriptional regulator YafY
MDILKYGAQVEVLEPLKLRNKILEAISSLGMLYQS